MPISNKGRRKLARQSLAGLSVGDAFGQQFVSQPELIGRRELPMFPWTFTDDTVMGIAITQTLEVCGEINQSDLAQRFATMYAEDPHRGYGDTAHKILRTIANGKPWREVSSKAFGGSGSMGNGAAMRAAPVGAYFFDDPEKAADQAISSAQITHMHPDGIAGAIAVAVAAAFACKWQSEECVATKRETLMETVLPFVPESVTRKVIQQALELPEQTTHQQAAGLLGNGEQIISQDTVPFCLWSAQQCLLNFTESMWQTASVFGDIDTNCAIVGSITVLAGGSSCIPEEWILSREPLIG